MRIKCDIYKKFNETKWWVMKLKKKIKKLTIKKMRIKLNTKNKWNDTFIFWQGEEREKKKRGEKQSSSEQNQQKDHNSMFLMLHWKTAFGCGTTSHAPPKEKKKGEKQSSSEINHTSPCTRAEPTKRSRRHVSNVALKNSILMWNDIACTT